VPGADTVAAIAAASSAWRSVATMTPANGVLKKYLRASTR
jgi:hypothetical protein